MKKPVVTLVACAALMIVTTTAQAVDAKVKAKYDKACTFCHGTGAAGAPRTGDSAAWQPRLAKGIDVLLQSVKNGKNAMPKGGMCTDCTDADYKALIQYISSGK